MLHYWEVHLVQQLSHDLHFLGEVVAGNAVKTYKIPHQSHRMRLFPVQRVVAKSFEDTFQVGQPCKWPLQRTIDLIGPVIELQAARPS